MWPSFRVCPLDLSPVPAVCACEAWRNLFIVRALSPARLKLWHVFLFGCFLAVSLFLKREEAPERMPGLPPTPPSGSSFVWAWHLSRVGALRMLAILPFLLRACALRFGGIYEWIIHYVARERSENEPHAFLLYMLLLLHARGAYFWWSGRRQTNSVCLKREDHH